MKQFNELVKLDLTKHTQKKPTFYKDKSGSLVKTSEDKWLDYIEWAKVLELLYDNGAEMVSFYSEIHKEKPNTLIIKVMIDKFEFSCDYPIIDGNTIIKEPNQMQLHKAELRGFVKCVAIHTGLGLSLWMKEEKQLNEVVSTEKTKPAKPIITPQLFERAKLAVSEKRKTPIEISEIYTISDEQLNELKSLELC